MHEKGIVHLSFEAPLCIYVISQTRFSLEFHRILLRMSRSVKERPKAMRGRALFKSFKAKHYLGHQENYLNGSCLDSLCKRGNDG